MKAIHDSTERNDSDTGPFALVPEWVLDSEVSANAVRLYAVLGRYVDSGGTCWPSRRTLAERLKMSKDTVDRSLKELRAIDAVSIVSQFTPGGDQTANLYIVHRVRPEMQRGGREFAATPDRTDAATGGRVVAAQNESHAEREPIERDLAERPQDEHTPDPLLVRLLKVCTGPRIRVVREAPLVLIRLREHFADHVIDEGIGVCELLETPPQFPRYLLKVVQERSEETGLFVPDLFEGFKGDAA